jgi:hypothetical protein
MVGFDASDFLGSGRHNGAFRAQRPANENLCVTCGGTSRLLHGYVYDDNAYGIYFLEWCDVEHPHSSAFLTISLDAFHEGGDAHYRKRVQHRVAAGLQLTYGPARHRREFLGAFLPRETALQDPRIDRLWHAAEHIVLEDPRIAAIEAWLKLGSCSRQREPRR